MEEEKQNNNPIENTDDKGVPSSPAENNSEQEENTLDNTSVKTEETENTENSPKQEEVIIENEPDFFDRLSKKAIWLALGLAACIAFCVYYDFLIFDKVLLYTDIGSDSVNIFYPVWAHYADLWREPGIPSWSMQMAMGQSVGYAGITDPFFMIYVLLGKSNIPYAIAYVEVSKILLTVIFIFYFLSYQNLKPLVCIIGSLLFAFSGYMIMGTSGWAYHSHEALLIAFFLMIAEKYVKDKTWYWVTLFAFILAWTNFVLLVQLLVIMVAFVIFRNYIHENKINFKSVFVVFISYLAGIFLAFPSVKNGFEFVLNNGRTETMAQSATVNNYKHTGIFSLSESEEYNSILFRLFSNDLLGTGSDFKGWFNYLESPILYIGLPCLIFCIAPFFMPNKKQKKTYIIVLLICLILLVFPWFRYAYWGFNLNYFRSFGFFISVVLFFVAMQGLNYFLSDLKKPKLLLYTIGISLFLLFIYPGNSSNLLNNSQRMFVGLFLLAYGSIIYAYAQGKNRLELKWGLLALVVLELGLQSHTTVNNRNTLSEKDLQAGKLYGDSTLQVVKWLKQQDSSFYRIAKYYPSGPAEHMSMNDAMVQGFNGLIGYSSQHQKYYMRFLRATDCVDPNKPDDIKWTYKILSRPNLCSFAGAKYFIDKEPMKLDTNLYLFKAKKYGIYIYESKIALPLAVAYDTYITEKNYQKLSLWNKQYVLYKAIVVDETQLPSIKNLKSFNLKDTIVKSDKLAFLKAANERKAMLNQQLKVINKSISGNLEPIKACVISFQIPYDRDWNIKSAENEIKLFNGNIGFICLDFKNGNQFFTLSH
jgi:hypothetical protein